MSEWTRIEADDKRTRPTASSFDARLLDVIERGAVALLTLFFLARFIPTITLFPYNLLLVLGETLTAWFILVRRTGEAAAKPGAWIAAFVGTFSPLLARPGGAVLLPPTLGVLLMTAGLTLSIGAKAFLRRSFGIVAANRGIRRKGPYRLVRHPMYLGYLLTHLGFMTLSFMVTNLLVYLACWTAMAFRIRAEEQILSQDPVYRDYSREVRWRLMPGVW